ncbi:alpha/beta hydrolase [Planktothrix sp. FACHB-1355]|uniref:Alpha/beta hydrolase n=1 Tax=Aerosakkonema funiforme FACHB-1375 TaxID=2949571 RepID=A0A926VFZ1_9CYAN|nr:MULTISPECIES: alpha/beta hydrolase [Oscillatoriales]MBD2183266.1 alpha/beta hydrolase [Aerosakkonema funiforme FACHB-1375]MBD3560744.1 alpha/beta hydrolase [Planktothrix sp. FACHB-1355]
MPEIVIDNVLLHYQCFGEGEDLVLIHGLAANLAFWYPGIASMLAQKYRVITYDLRGHGKSGMPVSGYSMGHMEHDLQGLLNHLGITRAHIVGHSFGARIAVHYAVSHPQQVATLTIADTQFRCLQPKMRLGDWLYWQSWKEQLLQHGVALPSDDEFISFKLLLEFDRIFNELTQKGIATKPSKLSLKNRDLGRKGAANWQKLMDTTTAKQEFDEGEEMTQEDIKKISMPTLAFYGEYSHCMPSCWKFKESIENCQVAVMPEVGHFHPVVKPELFVETLGQFLQAHPFNLGNFSSARSNNRVRPES